MLAQQCPAPRDVEANVERIRALLRDWPDVDIAVFPELFVTGYQRGQLDELAVRLDGAAVTAVRRASADSQTAFVGGYLERGDGGAVYDSMLIVDATGTIAGNYRKTHLFGNESSAFVAGGQLACVEVGEIRIGPMICFDLEIPEVARTLAFQRPDIFVGIAANMEPFYDDHLVASRARALDNRTPLVYVNRTGCESDCRFVGGSRVIDGSGQVVVELGAAEGVAVVDVSLRRAAPADVDYLRHLRPELYQRTNSAGPR
ncbi:hypothetical protein A9X01_00425 [Mycobacterium asiaticum]|uniref:CN hydrolase domain-containing protein n=1 Tax=Mycobacterium asiaticum TaxID=1790 RepID=A0A1A3BGN6_MYCAS|nr:hypothetical protein A9X01_00425 [Mycobacterium asiaticum]